MTIDPSDNFKVTSRDVLDSNTLSDSVWTHHTLRIDLRDPSLNGQLLQFGFDSFSQQFENTSVYYDNINFRRIVIATIEIKPLDTEPSPVNPISRGLIPVAILMTGTFDALQVDATTLAFGPAGASIAHQQGHVEDVDGDGDIDLLVHFLSQETGIACGDTEVLLTGELFDGQSVEGSATITTVGRSCD